jgi:integrative and conjugative element protein (TIGR02256 family)
LIGRAKIELSPAVLAEMEAEAERHFPSESGGVLLGYRPPSCRRTLYISEVVGPGPRASHRRHRFEPDGAWQASAIAAAYERSSRTVTYLGDWHSHPRGSGRPSALDRATARKIARSPEARAPRPLLVILFGEPEHWRLAARRHRRRRLRPVRVLVDGKAVAG